MFKEITKEHMEVDKVYFNYPSNNAPQLEFIKYDRGALWFKPVTNCEIFLLNKEGLITFPEAFWVYEKTNL